MKIAKFSLMIRFTIQFIIGLFMLGCFAMSVPDDAGAQSKDEGYIDKIIVEGNRQIETTEILYVLEMVPVDIYKEHNIDKAIRMMQMQLPYFRKVSWQVIQENDQRILYIKVREKGRAAIEVKPVINMASRIHNLQWGMRTKSSLKKTLRRRPIILSNAEVSCSFSSRIWNYYWNIEPGEDYWLKKMFNLSISTDIYKLTDVIDKSLLLFPEGGGVLVDYPFLPPFLLRVEGNAHWLDYYQREGFSYRVDWHPSMESKFGILFREEMHSSLNAHPGWFFSKEKFRANPPITDGKMQSLLITYDLRTQNWFNSFSIEYSGRILGGDFDFTLYQAHIRRYIQLSKNILALRLKVGIADSPLPFQRQFTLGGIGTLRGYSFREFQGDNMILSNVEYRWKLFKSNQWLAKHLTAIFLTLFVDYGYVWNHKDKIQVAEVKKNIGVGIQVKGPGLTTVYNFARALESERQFLLSARFGEMF